MAVSRREIDGLLAIIKREFILSNKPVSIDDIFFYGSSELKLTKSDIEWIIKIQIENGTMAEDKLQPRHYRPFLSPDDLQIYQDIKERLTLENIEICIDIYFEKNKMREEYDRYPDLLQLEELFVEKFGRIEIEKFKEFVRDLVRKGKLIRTSTLTYMKIPKPPKEEKKEEVLKITEYVEKEKKED